MGKILTNKNSAVYSIIIIIIVCILYILTTINNQVVNGIDVQEPQRSSEFKDMIEKLKYSLNPYEEEDTNNTSGNYDLIHGEVIMPELGDPVVRAELGRATWHLLHAMAGRLPEDLTKEESETFVHFVYLTARLYPCGDCAKHFQKILDKIGPEADSRHDAERWICKIHNGANKFLKKDIFDCETVATRWPCYRCEDSDTSQRRFVENLKLES